MKVVDICNTIEEIAPKQLAESWDNVGLLIGDLNAQVTGVLIAVDLTFGAINKCLQNGCNMIVTHHPAIFTPLKTLDYQSYSSGLAIACIKNDINVYSAHTNMDMSEEGINFAFAKKLGIVPQKFLSDGLGVYGEYEGNFNSLVEDIVRLTNDSQPKTYQVKDASHNVAFIGGSGGRIDEIVAKCSELAIDTIISSEFKHNILLELAACNVNVIQIGHFESEMIFTDIIYNLLKSKSDNLQKYVSLI